MFKVVDLIPPLDLMTDVELNTFVEEKMICELQHGFLSAESQVNQYSRV